MDWSLAAQGLLWGLISAASLPVGAALGLWTQPPKRITSALMAFGGGALLFALTIELFGHALHKASDADGHITVPSYVLMTMAAAVVGGLLFQLLNKALDGKGGFLRKRSLVNKHIIREKRKQAREMLDSLGRVALLRALPPEEVIALVPYVRATTFEAGETIFQEGDPARWVYFVRSGEVEIVTGEEEGEEREVLATPGPEDVFGEVALVSRSARTATARAKTDVEVLRLPFSAFDQALRSSPKLQAVTSELVSSRLEELGERAERGDERAARWAKNARQNLARMSLTATSAEVHDEAEKHGTGAAKAIWLGIGLDAIPESLVIGMLVAGAAAAGTTMSLAFVVGVFLANLPEAMSSAVTMAKGGMGIPKVMWMWGSLCLLTGAGALIGAVMLPPDPVGTMKYVVLGIEGLAAGAMLTMIAETMLPEAFEQGGSGIVGLATLAGFLAALAVKLI